jgi:hypothetical protein
MSGKVIPCGCPRWATCKSVLEPRMNNLEPNQFCDRHDVPDMPTSLAEFKEVLAFMLDVDLQLIGEHMKGTVDVELQVGEGECSVFLLQVDAQTQIWELGVMTHYAGTMDEPPSSDLGMSRTFPLANAYHALDETIKLYVARRLVLLNEELGEREQSKLLPQDYPEVEPEPRVCSCWSLYRACLKELHPTIPMAPGVFCGQERQAPR